FGVAMILIAALAGVLRRLHSYEFQVRLLILIAIGMVGGLLAASTYYLNQNVVDCINRHNFYPRDLLEQALKADLLAEAPEESNVFVDGAHSWEGPFIAMPEFLDGFFRLHSHKHLNVLLRGRYIENVDPWMKNPLASHVSKEGSNFREFGKNDRVY